MLVQRYSEDALKDMLIPRENWKPFPTALEREPWENVPDTIREVHIKRGEERLGFEWPALPATRFLDYARDGNRSRYERLSFGRRSALSALVIAECMDCVELAGFDAGDGKGRRSPQGLGI